MSDRFDLLIEKYLEGALSPEERADLKQMLAGDSELRAEYVARVTEEAALRTVVRGEGVQTAEVTRRRQGFKGSRAGSRRRLCILPSAAAALKLLPTVDGQG